MSYDIGVQCELTSESATICCCLLCAGAELKSVPFPLKTIHQRRFAVALLLCKCQYHISMSGWVREWHPTQMREALTQLKEGADPLTSTHINAQITAHYSVSVSTNNASEAKDVVTLSKFSVV